MYLKPLQNKEYMLYDTLKFPELLRKLLAKGLDEEDASYDVEALFTSIPIDYIIEEIYEKEALRLLCKKILFKRFLKRHTSGCTFAANGELIRQTDDCPIGGNVSMIMASICKTKCLREVIKPLNPLFFGLYIDDGFCRGKQDILDEVGEGLNYFHPKFKFTVEEEPSKFLDSEFVKTSDGIIFLYSPISYLCTGLHKCLDGTNVMHCLRTTSCSREFG